MSGSIDPVPLPNVRGDKLYPFPENEENIQFKRLLSSKKENGPGEVPHSRVFQITVGDSIYALKVFNFFSLEDIRPFVPTKQHLLKDKIVRHHLDPFFAECRAFGRLVNKGKDGAFAVHCHGYILLSEAVERRIERQFGIHDWNREEADEGRPLRAIVKNYIRANKPFGRQKFPKMRKIIEQLNEMGIYNMDIRRENYLGGRLFDFSVAITTPHLSFWTELRSIEQIQEDMRYDLECFDYMVKELNEEKTQGQIKWADRLRPRPDSSIKKGK